MVVPVFSGAVPYINDSVISSSSQSGFPISSLSSVEEKIVLNFVKKLDIPSIYSFEYGGSNKSWSLIQSDRHFILGFVYEFGLLEMPCNYRKALAHYSMSALFHENAASMTRVINFCRNGREGIFPDENLVNHFVNYLTEYGKYVGVEQSGECALSIFKTLIDGSAFAREAHFCAAIVYRHGIGMNGNFSQETLYHYEAAVELGLPEAMLNLAYFYEIIDDVERDLTDREIYLAQLCMDELDVVLVSDDDPETLLAEHKKYLALYWYRKAADLSFPLACRSLYIIYAEMKRWSESLQICIRGAQLQDPECCLEIARRCIYDGQSMLHLFHYQQDQEPNQLGTIIEEEQGGDTFNMDDMDDDLEDNYAYKVTNEINLVVNDERSLAATVVNNSGSGRRESVFQVPMLPEDFFASETIGRDNFALAYTLLQIACKRASCRNRQRLFQAHLAFCNARGIGVPRNKTKALFYLDQIFSELDENNCASENNGAAENGETRQNPWQAFESDGYIDPISAWRLWKTLRQESIDPSYYPADVTFYIARCA